MIFGHIFCKDPIDIHEQIYGTLKGKAKDKCPKKTGSKTSYS